MWWIASGIFIYSKIEITVLSQVVNTFVLYALGASYEVTTCDSKSLGLSYVDDEILARDPQEIHGVTYNKRECQVFMI